VYARPYEEDQWYRTQPSSSSAIGSFVEQLADYGQAERHRELLEEIHDHAVQLPNEFIDGSEFLVYRATMGRSYLEELGVFEDSDGVYDHAESMEIDVWVHPESYLLRRVRTSLLGFEDNKLEVLWGSADDFTDYNEPIDFPDIPDDAPPLPDEYRPEDDE
jgi:hypothetical protein